MASLSAVFGMQRPLATECFEECPAYSHSFVSVGSRKEGPALPSGIRLNGCVRRNAPPLPSRCCRSGGTVCPVAFEAGPRCAFSPNAQPLTDGDQMVAWQFLIWWRTAEVGRTGVWEFC